MREDHLERLVRIEEGVKAIRDDVSDIKTSVVGITQITHKNSLEIVRLKSARSANKKWILMITTIVSACVGYLVEYFKK